MTDQPAAAPTPGPWEWSIHDHSMATLHGPDMLRDHVLSSSPCKACIERVKDGKWKWGRCTTPTEANAELLAASWGTAAERDRLKVVVEKLVIAATALLMERSVNTLEEAAREYPHGKEDVAEVLAVFDNLRAALDKARK